MKYEILSGQIAPFTRYISLRDVEKQPFVGVSYATDWRIFSVVSGECTLLSDDKLFTVGTGDTVLVPPMTSYAMPVVSKAVMYLVNFDMLSADRHLIMPIPTLRQKESDTAVHQKILFKDIPELSHTVRVHAPLAQKYLKSMHERSGKIGLYSRLEMNACLTLGLSTLFSVILNQETGSCIDGILQYISAHYPEKITNQSLGAHFHYHANYINRLFMMHTGQSLHQYVMSCRTHIAMDLLLSTDLSIAEIAEHTGWHSPSHFSRAFKQITGFTPMTFRKQ